MAVPEAVIRKHEALPVAWAPDGTLLVAMANPTDVYALDDIRNAVNRPVQAVVVTPSALLDAVRRSRRFEVTRTEAVAGMPSGPTNGAVATAVATRLRADEGSAVGEDAPIVKLVNQIIAQAVDERASDIHFEPTEHDMRPLPHGRRAPPGHALAQARPARDHQPAQDHGRHGHRRAAPAPGRPRLA